MSKKILACIVMLAASFSVALAGDSLKIKFRSRALLDASVTDYGKEDVQGYYRLEDFRVGFKANYGQFELKADIGFGGGKVAIKDLLFNYHMKNCVVAVGNAYEPFSMDMLISTVDMRFNQSATSVLAFTNSRKLGATIHYYLPSLYLATGVYTHNDINKIGSSQVNAFVSTSRAVWRRQKGDYLIHAGGAFSFRTRPVNTEGDPETEVSSAGVTSMLPNALLNAKVDHLGTEVKGLLEALYMSPKFMIQSEYFVDRYNRTQGEAYMPHGGYIQAGYLIKGRGFEYDPVYSIPGRPKTEKAIELTARLNYTDMNDPKAGISGGKETDLSVGANFYLNKYLAVKATCSYVFVGDNCNEFYQKDLLLGQIRIQYVF